MVESGHLPFRYSQRDAVSAQKYVTRWREMANGLKNQAG